MTFSEYLEQQGFQAAACESTIHPDFYALAERLWEEAQGKGRIITAQLSLQEMVRIESDRYREALESANKICRSAFAIADRDGKTTNWQGFRARCKDSLAIQHAALFPEQ